MTQTFSTPIPPGELHPLTGPANSRGQEAPTVIGRAGASEHAPHPFFESGAGPSSQVSPTSTSELVTRTDEGPARGLLIPFPIIPQRALPFDYAESVFIRDILIAPMLFGLEPSPCFICNTLVSDQASAVQNEHGELLIGHANCVKGCPAHGFVNEACPQCWSCEDANGGHDYKNGECTRCQTYEGWMDPERGDV